MLIEWKMKSSNFLDIIEIYINYNGDVTIFDKTSDKIFEKYLKNLCYNIQTYKVNFEFVNEEQKFSYNTLDRFIFTFEFPDEETAFYFKLKYGE